MKILAFDTAMAVCSVALVRVEGADVCVLASRQEAQARGHAETVVPSIAQVMEEAGVEFSELDRIAVTTGPGTFTGVRIGVATARGLALASGLPIVGVTTLETVAAAVADTAAARSRAIACVFDARREQVYVQCFDHHLSPLCNAQALGYEAARKLIAPHAPLIVGSGARLVVSEGQNGMCVLDGHDQPSAVDLARRAAAHEPDPSPPEPFYLRQPDAKLPQ